MQFKVPQNVDMEDKIVGPLTLIQFMELIFAGLIFYACLRYGGVILTVFVGVPVLLLGVALAFIKVQDQPFSHFALALVQFMVRPKFRVWKKDATLERIAVPTAADPTQRKEALATQAEALANRQTTRSQLQELSRALDTQGETAVEAMGGVTPKVLGEQAAAAAPKVIPVTGSKNPESRIQNPVGTA